MNEYEKAGYTKLKAQCIIVQSHPEYDFDKSADYCNVYIKDQSIVLDTDDVEFTPYYEARGIYTLEIKFKPKAKKPDYILNLTATQANQEDEDITDFELDEDSNYKDFIIFLNYKALDKKTPKKLADNKSKKKI